MKKKVMFCGIMVILIALSTICVFATTGYSMKYYPGTSDVVTNLPEEDVGTNGESYNVSSQIPQREGYEFLGWVLDYGPGYRVTYVVNPDLAYRTPEGSSVPIDSKAYAPGDSVDVVEQLTTTVDYAFNDKGEKIVGTWKFTPWDKDDFDIHEDTTITGGWEFTPAPPTKYKYTVHYVLWDDYLKGKTTEVADKKEVEIDSLGITVTEPAKTGKELKNQYKKNYQPVPGYESVTHSINRDGYEIWIFYQKKSSSS